MVLLDRKINGLPWGDWLVPFAGLTVASAIAAAASWFALMGLSTWGRFEGLIGALLELSVAGTVGLGLFAAIATRLGLPEVDLFVTRIRAKIGR
jgi:putative peptidoglycan lipid II flippase